MILDLRYIGAKKNPSIKTQSTDPIALTNPKPSVASRTQQAQDVNKLIQGLGDVAGAGTMMAAGYTPKGYTKQSAADTSTLLMGRNHSLSKR